MKQQKTIKAAFIFALVTSILAFIVLAFSFLYLKEENYLALIIFVVAVISELFLYISLTNYHDDLSDKILKKLDASSAEALEIAGIGVLVYDEKYEVSYLSNYLKNKSIDKIGEKLLVWLPELQDLLSGRVEKTTVIINDDKYEVTKKENAYTLFFNDVSNEYDLKKELDNKGYVLGLVNFDNYDELSLNEDEITFINSNIRLPVVDYFRKYGVVYKTLRNNRLQLLLNNKIYNQLLDDRFSILNKVRKEARSNDLNITLSMAFALGSDDFNELDVLVSDLIEIAENRGGDQVATRVMGQETVFYGGSSEAKERQSKVKVRVIANTLKRLINEASKVFIVGHEEADSDCVGSALAMSLICKTQNKDAYIVLNSGVIEPMVKDVLNKYKDVLKDRHNFISENESFDLLDDKSLVIMVDHHSINNSNCKELLKIAKNIAIIDHHRRKADLDVDTTFLYVEAGASSATEMIVEMFSYFSRNLEVLKEEANIMYIGLLIDTNHFKDRTNSRTFDVAKIIKQYGAESRICEELIEEPYDMIRKRYEILSNAKRYKDNIMIANVDEIYPRSIASQAVNIMIDIKEIDCAFVIWKLSNNEVAISARSDGAINVQLIMEKLGGGGHLTAAGIQTKDFNQDEMYDKLITALNEYLESEKNDESNIVD